MSRMIEHPAMPKDAMTKLLETAEKVRRLEAELHEAREQLRIDLAATVRSPRNPQGETQTALAERLGLSRTRIKQLLDESPGR
jgi:DNA-binding XRE family transcriptional regulator